MHSLQVYAGLKEASIPENITQVNNANYPGIYFFGQFLLII